MKVGDRVLVEAVVTAVYVNAQYVTVAIPMQRNGGGSTPLPVAIETSMLRPFEAKAS